MSQCFRLFEVKRNGYYKASKRLMKDETALLLTIKACFNQHKQSYGRRRLKIALLADYKIRISKRRLSKLMKAHGLLTVWRGKKFRYATKESECSPYLNVLDRQFKCDQPNHSWVSDMRSTASQDIRTLSGWYYLAAVMDLYSRKIVGFAMSHSATAELACQALQMAIAVRQPPAGLIIHSDQGCQYTSKIYQNLVTKHQLKGSMSRRGNCWDNAVMERFFRNLKQEQVWRYSYANHQEAQQSISSYILDVYNSTRLHSTLKYLSPNAFEAKMRDTQQSNEVVT